MILELDSRGDVSLRKSVAKHFREQPRMRRLVERLQDKRSGATDLGWVRKDARPAPLFDDGRDPEFQRIRRQYL